MYEVSALKYGEHDTSVCQFFSGKLIVAGHDPEVAGRFTIVAPGVVRVA